MKSAASINQFSKYIPTVIFVIGGVLVLAVTGYLLSNSSTKFYEPQPGASSTCYSYGNYSAGTCNNALCTTSVGSNLGNKCMSPNPKSGSGVVTRCRIQGEQDTITDCCLYGNPSSTGVCPASGTPTLTPTLTSTPTASYCSTYGNHTRLSCTNSPCPSGRNCVGWAIAGASDTKCLSRVSSADQILDCCAAGIPLQGSTCVYNTPTPTPSRTATPTPTTTRVPTPPPTTTVPPTTVPATCNLGSHPKYSCGNPRCTTGSSWYNCTDHAMVDAVKYGCVFQDANYDYSVNCCAIGTTPKLHTDGKYYCVLPTATPTATVTHTATPPLTTLPPTTVPTTSTPTNTPNPTAYFCTNYSAYPNSTCTNQICSSTAACAQQSLQGANHVKCLKRTNYERVYDCCAEGQTISSGTCVSSTPTPTGTDTPTPTLTTSPTNTQTPTPTVSTTGTPTGTGTDTPMPTATGTPKVTHTPSETGFAEDALIYIGGSLYVIGVVFFIVSRQLNARKVEPLATK